MTKSKKSKKMNVALELEKKKRDERKKRMSDQEETKEDKNIPKTFSEELQKNNEKLYEINEKGIDKDLIKEYETLMGDKAKDNPMGYIDWLKKKIAKIEDYYKLDTSKLSDIKKKDRLRKVAFEISKRFSYSKIKESIAGEGLEVHSFLQNNFDDYDELIDNYVLDTACAYAKREYIPEIIKFMYYLDLNQLTITRIELEEEDELPNYPQLTFSEVYVLAKKPLTEAITWIPKFSYDIDGFNAHLTYGPANIGLLDWVVWNKPLVVVLHAVGKSEGFFKAVSEAKAIVDKKEDIYKTIIHQSRTAFQPLLDKLDEVVRDSLQSDKKYTLLKKKIERSIPSDILSDYEEIERQMTRTSYNQDKINWKKIGIIALVLFGIVFIVWLIFGLPMLLTQPLEQATTTPPIP